jgi:TP901 family phage tail tape measure protein
MTVSELTIKITLQDDLSKSLQKVTDGMEKSLDSAKGSFSQFQEKFNEWGASSAVQNVMQSAFSAIIDGTWASIQAFGEFEQGMTDVQKIAGGTSEEIENLGDKIRDAVTVELKGTSTVSELQAIAGEAARAGIAADNMDRYVVSIAKMAEMWGVSKDKASEYTSLIMSQYNIGTDLIENFGSAVDQAGDSFAVSEDYLLRYAQRLSGTAEQTGMAIEHVLAIGAVAFQNTGMQVEASSTALMNVLNSIQMDVEAFSDVLGGSTEEWSEKINTDGMGALQLLLQKLEELKNTEGPEAMTQAMDELFGSNVRVNMLLKGMIGKNAELTQAYNDVNAAALEGTRISENFAKTTDTQNAGFSQIIGQIHDLAISVGEELNPSVEGTVSVFNNALLWMNDAFKEWRYQIKDEFFTWVASLYEPIDKLLSMYGTAFKAFTSKENFQTASRELNNLFKEPLTSSEEFQTSLAELGAQMNNMEGVSRELKDEYKAIFMETRAAIQDNVPVSEELTQRFEDMRQKVEEIGVEAYKEGTFSDTTAAMKGTSDEAGILVTNLNNVNNAVIKVGESTSGIVQTGANSWSNIKREVGDTGQAVQVLSDNIIKIGQSSEKAGQNMSGIVQTGVNAWSNIEREVGKVSDRIHYANDAAEGWWKTSDNAARKNVEAFRESQKAATAAKEAIETMNFGVKDYAAAIKNLSIDYYHAGVEVKGLEARNEELIKKIKELELESQGAGKRRREKINAEIDSLRMEKDAIREAVDQLEAFMAPMDEMIALAEQTGISLDAIDRRMMRTGEDAATAAEKISTMCDSQRGLKEQTDAAIQSMTQYGFSVDTTNRVLNQTGVDILALTERLQQFDDMQLQVLSRNLGENLFKFNDAQLQSVANFYDTMESNQASLQAIAEDMLKKGTLPEAESFSSLPNYAKEGIGLQGFGRMQLYSDTQTPILSNTASGPTSAAQPMNTAQQMNVTLVMNDQEVGRLTSIVGERQQTVASRTVSTGGVR